MGSENIYMFWALIAGCMVYTTLWAFQLTGSLSRIAMNSLWAKLIGTALFAATIFVPQYGAYLAAPEASIAPIYSLIPSVLFGVIVAFAGLPLAAKLTKQFMSNSFEQVPSERDENDRHP